MISAPRSPGCLRGCAFAVAALLLSLPAAAAEFPLAPGERVVGQLQDYVVQQGDNFADIARKFDIGYTEMLAANPGVEPWLPRPGTTLTIPSLYILPDAPRQGIVINLGERRIYYYPPGGKSVVTYPIGIGVIGADTPLSTTKVVRKEPNPVWIPPASIHAENPDLPDRVGPGPDNPLGDFALRLGWTNYLIHGTNKPDGVGRNVSHGCIHLYPEDIEALFKMVAVGTPVRAIEQEASAAWMGIGLYVEVHPTKEQADAIDMEQPVTPVAVPGLREQVAAVAGDYAQAVDLHTVDLADTQRTGLPIQVAQRPPPDVSQAQPPDVATAAPPPPPRGRGSRAVAPPAQAPAVDPTVQDSALPLTPGQSATYPSAAYPPQPAPGAPTPLLPGAGSAAPPTDSAQSLTPIFNTLQPPPNYGRTRPYGDD
jgi:L,D-transpeptidase ErfK/SrfK